MNTAASILDRIWLEEFFTLALAFFVFINCVFILALAADAPHVIYIVIRVFGGTVFALINHIIKGFSLYDELTV